MLKQEGSSGHGGGSSGWSRACDSCRTTACAVYCRADLAYLCAGCDARIHAANRVASRHERVWMCEACKHAPAAFTCKADAAALCTTCDDDIHSANLLAQRHHRVPIVPIFGCLYGPSSTHHHSTRSVDMEEDSSFLVQEEAEEEEIQEDENEDETASWLLINPPVKNNNSHNNNLNNNRGFLLGDEYLDLGEYNSCNENQYQDQYNQHNNNFSVHQVNNDGTDSVVPVQIENHRQHQQNFQLEMDYEASKAGFSYTPSISHSVSFSSMDASIVPDSTMNEISNSHSRPPKGIVDLFSSPPLQMPAQFSPLDREARVLRYREKRKTRKFEKTIRYASRKAYAETRPRIKGRFAKRTDVEVEVDQMFSTSLMVENGYGVVPSF